MATKLKRLKVKRVAFVDEGANPDAHICFAKNRDGQPTVAEDAPTEAEKGVIKRLIESIAKAFGVEPVEKAAFTFAEGEEKRDYDKIMSGEVYPMSWAFMDSVSSILFDPQKSDEEKAALLKQSLSEFSTAFEGNVENWAKAQSAEAVVKEDVATLEKMRDNLSQLIEKGASGEGDPVIKADEPDDDDPEEDDPDDDDHDDDGGNEPPVKKGATDMIFDTSKMTPEEKATFDDLAKRFGTEEAPTTPAAPTTDPAPAPAATAGDDDIHKGLHPAIQEELRKAREFRENVETQQLTEVAKKYALLGKKPEELVPVLKSLKAAGGSAYDDMIGLLDSNLAAVEKSGVFSEIGKRGSEGSSGDNAWGKIEAAAQEIIKSKPGMRWADAVDAACCAHPELVQEYEKSR